ncbi:hypothetical protein CLOM_g19483 [Closterium sp. NIES-68]|nr:hypothetical protein CLOM_g19483 [Closterium sp. NIES-68]
MGHVALPILQQIVKQDMVSGIRVKGEPNEVLGCPTCMQAKFTRYPFHSSETTAKAPLDEVVMDVVGPLKLGAAGAEYFLTIVDVYTRMTWVYVLPKKSDVAETVKTDWLPMVERQQDRLVKAIRTDRGGEDCKFMENLPYKEWKAENQAKIGVRLGEVKSTGLEHVELPLELSSSSTITRQSPQMNGGEEEEEVQQGDERTPSLPPRATSARGNRADLQQRHESIQVPAVEEEGRGRRKTQPPNRLSYERLGGAANSTLTGSALMLGDEAEDESEECAFAFFSPVEIPGEPTNPKEAWEGPNGKEWKKASDEEMGSIIENDTFDLVNLPPGRKAISSKWLFKRKTDADGNIERYKSRLVAKGYQQQEKKDYNEVYAPVVKGTTLRTLFAAAAIKGWVVKQMDIVTAFLNGVLEEETYMEQPEGYNDGSGRVWKLKKALYGLKQAPRQWYIKLREVLEAIGFTPSTADQSLFMLGEGEQRSFMVAAGERVAKYFGQTATVGLQYSAAAQRRQKGADGVEPGRFFLTAFSDASWASEPEDMTSVGGFICCVGGGPTAWESKKQVDQALSSVESEYMALFRAIREVVWQRRLLAELGEEQQGPTPLYCDSQD